MTYSFDHNLIIFLDNAKKQGKCIVLMAESDTDKICPLLTGNSDLDQIVFSTEQKRWPP